MSREMTCGVVRDLLPLYADDVASPDSRALVEEHLKGCEDCRAELEQLERAVQLPPERDGSGEVRRWKRGLNRWLGRTVALCLGITAAAAALRGRFGVMSWTICGRRASARCIFSPIFAVFTSASGGNISAASAATVRRD